LARQRWKCRTDEIWAGSGSVAHHSTSARGWEEDTFPRHGTVSSDIQIVPDERVAGPNAAPLHEPHHEASKSLDQSHGTMASNSIIVQCLKCNKVLSDSTALVLSDKERKILGVKGASSIQVHEVRHLTHLRDTRSDQTIENLTAPQKCPNLSRPNSTTAPI
jgi:hypothetical protein